MSEPIFLRQSAGLTIGEIAQLTGAAMPASAAAARRITDIAVLDRAGPSPLAYCDDARLALLAAASHAGACLTRAALAQEIGFRPGVCVLAVKEPYAAFVKVACALFPQALRPSSFYEGAAAAGAHIDPSARLEEGVTVEPGAVVGPGAGIGSGTVIAANAVIGAGVQIGRNCFIGAGATVEFALIGDRVTLHAGCRIGQAAPGEAPGGRAPLPALGRVIIQDGSEIGAGSTLDRGSTRDTVIGEGTKVDNLVRVGQNAQVGRHCILAAQAAISAGAIVEDHALLARHGASAAAPRA